MSIIEKLLLNADNNLDSVDEDSTQVCIALAKLYWATAPYRAKAYALRAISLGAQEGLFDLNALDEVISEISPEDDLEGAYMLGKVVGSMGEVEQAIQFLAPVAESLHKLAGPAALELADLLSVSVNKDGSYRQLANQFYRRAAECHYGDILPFPAHKRPAVESLRWGA